LQRGGQKRLDAEIVFKLPHSDVLCRMAEFSLALSRAKVTELFQFRNAFSMIGLRLK
jgi:hypothetical protein